MKTVKLFLFICFAWLLRAPAARAQEVTVRRVSEHVIILSMSGLGSHTNITVIESQKGLVVVETEITPYIMNVIKETAENTLERNDWAYVINTHGHIHHAGGNAAFKGAQFIGHESLKMDWLIDRLSTEAGRRQYCSNVGADEAVKQLREALSKNTLSPIQKEVLQYRLDFCCAVEKEIMDGFEVVNPTITFSDEYDLDLGDIHLHLTYWGDGICHSSIFCRIVEDKVLVGMGMAGTWIPGFYGKVTLEGIRRGIALNQQLSDESLPIEQIIGIHNPEIFTSRQHFRNTHRYLNTLMEDLTKAVEKGWSTEQIRNRLTLEKRYSFVRKCFTMPEDIDEAHQKNIDTIWSLLQAKSASPPQKQ